ncbi:hypothetical protein K9M41_02865 [Candidatus Gracilibacteria bacterium]|nr:hypothetical protein [Candidatus Gracilibacteria bacterium]
MKKYLLLGTIFLTTTCFAVTKMYPDVLTPKDKEDGLATLQGLQEMYSRIYMDVHEEDNTEILSRVGQHGTGFGEELTESEKNTLQELSVPNLSHEKRASLEGQVGTSLELSQLYEYEKDLLRLENNLARRNGLRSIFRNGTDKDSPFDVIQDLHLLDELFHGEKFAEQKPVDPFFLEYEQAQKEYQEEYQYDYVLEKEPWQDQREENLTELFLDFTKRKYEDPTRSLTGRLFWLESVLAELAKYPLVGGIATKSIFEPGLEAGISGDSAAGIHPTDVPFPDKTPLEYEQVKEEKPGNKYAEYLQNIVKSSFLERNELGGKDVPQVLFESGVNDSQEEEEFATKMREFSENSELGIADEEKRTLVKILTNFNEDLRSFTKQLIEINRIFEKDFLTKPQT